MVTFINAHYNLISLIIQLLIAIGTIGAVITALHLARSSNKLKMRLTMDIAIKEGENGYKFGGPILDKKGEKVIICHVENTGTREIILSRDRFRLKIKGDRAFRLMIPKYLEQYPIKLESFSSTIVEFNTYDKFISIMPINEIKKPFYLSPIGEVVYGKISKTLKKQMKK